MGKRKNKAAGDIHPGTGSCSFGKPAGKRRSLWEEAKGGALTVYLALALGVFLTLVYVGIDSVRLSCGRALVSAAAEEALFSLFGEYDRELYEDYGLLFIDAGFGGEEIKAGELMTEAVQAMEEVIHPQTGLMGSSSSDLFRICLDLPSVTGYTLATDGGYEPLKKQICALMKEKTGIEAAKGLTGGIIGASDALRTAEEGDSTNLETLQTEYESSRTAILEQEQAAQAEAVYETEEEKKAAEAAAEEKAASREEAERLEEPITNIKALQQMGYWAFLVPDGMSVSGASIDRKTLASKEGLNTGLSPTVQTDSSITERFFLAKYLTDYFSNYVSCEESSGLCYQAEYAIAGKASDVENLKSVCKRLVVMRSALNLAALNTMPEKKAEADALALSITSALLMPQLEQVVSEVILGCWAYGEALVDVKTLLAGGKIPIYKDESSWNLDLQDLSFLSAGVSVKEDGNGLDYREYLCALLLMHTKDRLLTDTADLIEFNMRMKENYEKFSIDVCVSEFELSVEGTIGTHEFSLVRSYAYDKE